MDLVNAIVELFAKLGFNFWQVFVLIIIIIFRKHIIATISRITSIKSPAGEILFGNPIEEIVSLENKTSELPDGKPKNEMFQGLQSLKRELLIAALVRIRTNTSFLWPGLVSSCENKKKMFRTEIRASTFSRIRNDMALLEKSNLLQYKYTERGTLRYDTVLKLTVFDIQDELFELVNSIQKRAVA